MANNTHQIPTQDNQNLSSNQLQRSKKIAGKHHRYSGMVWEHLVVGIAFLLLFFLLWMKCAPEVAIALHVKFIHDSASDILMGLLVAFLPIILAAVGSLRDKLSKHEVYLDSSKQELKLLQEDFVTTKEELGDVREKVKQDAEKLGNTATDMVRIYRSALESVNRDAYRTLLSRSAALTCKWGDLMLRKHNPQASISETSFEHALSRCLEIMYMSYVNEEIRDLEKQNFPLVTTNYPTYLNFINNLASSFIDGFKYAEAPDVRAELQKYKTCIIVLADTMPIGFLMNCWKEPDHQWLCETNKEIVNWRGTSKNIAANPNCLFERVFLTTSHDNLGIAIPINDNFEDLLNKCYIWFESNDISPLLEVGFPSRLEKQCNTIIGASPAFLKYKDNANIFYISHDKSIKSGMSEVLETGPPLLKLNQNPIPVKHFVGEVHNHKPECAQRVIIADQNHLKRLGHKAGFPTDMFVIGLVPSTVNDLKANIQTVEPIMAVGCLYNNSDPDVSVLGLYLREHFKASGSVWDWVKKLVATANPL